MNMKIVNTKLNQNNRNMKTITHNGVPCVEARVHIVATEDKSNIILKNNLQLEYNEVKPSYGLNKLEWKYHHLYITTDEKLPYESKVFDNGAFYHVDPLGRIHIITKDTFKPNPNFCKRIISSTDKSLDLPRIPQSFIEEYYKAGGIDKVMVEYDKILGDWFEIPQPCRVVGGPYKKRTPTKYKPKTDSNNCIIIHPVEEKMYSREEVEELCKKAYKEKYKTLEDWIKENL